MIKLGKKTLFAILILMSTCTGISAYLIDWQIVKSGDGVFQEIHQTLLFIGITVYFLFPYIKALKAGRN